MFTTTSNKLKHSFISFYTSVYRTQHATMALSGKELQEVLDQLEAKREADIKSKSYDNILTNYYKHAVIVQNGPGGTQNFFGFDGIRKAYEPFMAIQSDAQSPFPKTLYASSTPDGEYLLQRGTYQIAPSPKEHNFELVYKKIDGKYLIFHDEFDFFP